MPFLVRHLLPESGTSPAASAAGGSVSVFAASAGLSVAGLVFAPTFAAPNAASASASQRSAAAGPDPASLGTAGMRPAGPLPLPTLVLAITTAVALIEHVPNIDVTEPDFTNRVVSALVSLGNRPDCPEQVRVRAHMDVPIPFRVRR